MSDKRCPNCGSDGPFGKEAKRLDGLTCWCRPCLNTSSKASRLKKIDHYRAVNRRWNELHTPKDPMLAVRLGKASDEIKRQYKAYRVLCKLANWEVMSLYNFASPHLDQKAMLKWAVDHLSDPPSILLESFYQRIRRDAVA